VFAASVVTREVRRATSQTLRATFLDVGQGDACVVELPHGRVMVVDGGGTFDPSFDPGRQVIAPFLWRHGIRRIDLMVLSHPHPDHANGLATLVEQFPVGALWTNGQETSQPGTVALLAAAQRHAVPVPLPRALDLGGAQVVPLAPFDDSGALAVDAARSENDNSLVVAVGWRDRRLLFAGDIEAEGEAALLARVGAGARADVVKVPHVVDGGAGGGDPSVPRRDLGRRAQSLGLSQRRGGRALAGGGRPGEAHRPRRRGDGHRRYARSG
jgi:competence protein ComEC